MAVYHNQGILKEDWVMKEQAPFYLRYLPLIHLLACSEGPNSKDAFRHYIVFNYDQCDYMYLVRMASDHEFAGRLAP